jgi:hypothetical protein
MTIYQDTCEGATPDQLRGFFVGWPNPLNSETHLRILSHSDAVVLVIDRDPDRLSASSPRSLIMSLPRIFRIWRCCRHPRGRASAGSWYGG